MITNCVFYIRPHDPVLFPKDADINLDSYLIVPLELVSHKLVEEVREVWLNRDIGPW